MCCIQCTYIGNPHDAAWNAAHICEWSPNLVHSNRHIDHLLDQFADRLCAHQLYGPVDQFSLDLDGHIHCTAIAIHGMELSIYTPIL